MSETPYGQDGTAAERPVDTPTDAGRATSEVAATIDAQVDEVTEQAGPSAAGPGDADVTARVDSEVLLPAVAGGSTVQDEGGGAVTTGEFEAERADRSISLSSQVDETADGAEASATAAPADDHASGTTDLAAPADDHASGTTDLAAPAGAHASGPAHPAATHGEVDQAAADAGAGAQAASGADAGPQSLVPGSTPVSASDQVDQPANGPGTGQAGPRSTSMAAGGQVDEAASGGRRGSISVAEGGAAELEDPERLRAAVEAVLLVVDTPTSATDLAQVLGRPVAEVEEALRSLQADYDAGGRGMDLREVAERLAALQPGGLRPVRRALRPRRPAGAAHPGGAGDTGGDRVPAAGDAVTHRGDPGCERRRGDAYPAHPGPRGGVRRGPGHRRWALPDDAALPREGGAPVTGRVAVSCSTPTRYLAAGRCRSLNLRSRRMASVCRRSSPPPAWAPAVPARS